MKKQIRILAGVLVLLALVLSACAKEEAPVQIRISSKNFTEQFLLGNMYEMLLDEAGFDATYESLGGTSENHDALLAGEIDIYPEYTGTALLTHLEGNYDPSMSADDVYSTVAAQYAERWDLELLKSTGFNNTYCLTMTQAMADDLGVTTLSDLSVKAPDLVFGTTQEFPDRPDGRSSLPWQLKDPSRITPLPVITTADLPANVDSNATPAKRKRPPIRKPVLFQGPKE